MLLDSSLLRLVPLAMVATKAENSRQRRLQMIQVEELLALASVEPKEQRVIHWIFTTARLEAAAGAVVTLEFVIVELLRVLVEVVDERFVKAELLVVPDEGLNDHEKERVDATQEC